VEYIKALYSYRDSVHRDNPAPFQMVHSILARKLQDFPSLVVLIRTDKLGKDIFRNSNECAEWRKVNIS